MTPGVTQRASASAGFAYGVIGADVHCRADGSPIYVLLEGVDHRGADRGWLAELPSRMLNASFGVVDFVGRHRELANLHRWRSTGQRLRARLVHGPGGQGKSRLARRFADEARQAGWQVVTAIPGNGNVLPSASAHDLRETNGAGLLLIVDYADRWPTSDLAMLFANSVLHQRRPTRLLLLARGALTWPSLVTELDRVGAECTKQPLPDLPVGSDARAEMFSTARRCFSDVYGVDEPSDAPPPAAVVDDAFAGLTLAIHIAALVCVDAHVHGLPVPHDQAGLTIYLVDREHRHWALLHEQRQNRTPSTAMNRIVYLAALTGQTAEPDGVALVEPLGIDHDAATMLAEHATCYPAAGLPGRVLEPLYPDRLAEDFLALTLPGHVADYDAQEWAPAVAHDVVRRSGLAPAPSRARAITFLAASAARWPHLREQHLSPMILSEPVAVIDAGSAALTAVAAIPDVEIAVLEALEGVFPPDSDIDLDPGMAAIQVVLTERRLQSFQSPTLRAEAHKRCGFRLNHASRFAEALEHEDAALSLLRGAGRLVGDELLLLGVVLWNRAVSLGNVGRREESVSCNREAIAVHRELAAEGAPSDVANLAEVLGNMSVALSRMNERRESITHAEEAVALLRTIPNPTPEQLAKLTRVELNLSTAYSERGRWDEALSVALDANLRLRELAEARPSAHGLAYAQALRLVAERFTEMDRHDEALPFAQKSTTLIREYTSAGSAHPGHLSVVLSILSRALAGTGRTEEAVSAASEAVDIDRTNAALEPQTFGPDVAKGLDELGLRLAAGGRHAEAVAAARECVAIRREYVAANPEVFGPDLAAALHNLARFLFKAGHLEEAVSVEQEVISLRRRVIEEGAGRHDYMEPDLTVALNNLAYFLVGLVRRDFPWRPLGFSKRLDHHATAMLQEASALLDEAVDRYTRLLPTHPTLNAHRAESIDLRDGIRRRLAC